MATLHPVYSERFLSMVGGTQNKSYFVPAGRRALVKYVSALNAAAPASTAYLTVAGVTCWLVSLPGQYSFSDRSLFVVAYQGEELKLTASTGAGGTVAMFVGGQLLTEA